MHAGRGVSSPRPDSNDSCDCVRPLLGVTPIAQPIDNASTTDDWASSSEDFGERRVNTTGNIRKRYATTPSPCSPHVTSYTTGIVACLISYSPLPHGACFYYLYDHFGSAGGCNWVSPSPPLPPVVRRIESSLLLGNGHSLRPRFPCGVCRVDARTKWIDVTSCKFPTRFWSGVVGRNDYSRSVGPHGRRNRAKMR